MVPMAEVATATRSTRETASADGAGRGVRTPTAATTPSDGSGGRRGEQEAPTQRSTAGLHPGSSALVMVRGRLGRQRRRPARRDLGRQLRIAGGGELGAGRRQGVEHLRRSGIGSRAAPPGRRRGGVGQAGVQLGERGDVDGVAGVGQPFVHRLSSLRCPSSAASRARPRAQRLFTVPTGTSRIAAASATG